MPHSASAAAVVERPERLERPRALVIRFVAGTACMAIVFAMYLAAAPPLLFEWQAGGVTPFTAGGWFDWPQWVSSALVAAACGLVYFAAARLGAHPVWAASAMLSCGAGWMMLIVAVVPSARSIAMLLAGLGIAAAALATAGDARFVQQPRSRVWLALATAAIVASAWVQPLLPPGAVVQMASSPRDVASAFSAELRPAAIIVFALGCLELWSRARAAAIACGVILAVYLGLPVVAGVSADAALLPASLVLWVIGAFGLQWIARAVPGRAGLLLAAVLAVLIPGERWLVHHTLVRRAALPFFPGSLAASLAAIPSNGTLVSDGPALDRRIGRAAAALPVGPFRIGRVDISTSNEAEVFAFRTLPIELTGGRAFHTVPRRVPLSAFLHMLPPDNIVALVLTPTAAGALSRGGEDYFAGIGAPAASADRLASALVGRAGAPSGALVQQDRNAARIAVARDTPWGDPPAPSPIAIDAVADRNFATISVEGREIVRVPHGGAVVVTTREGSLQMVHTITLEQQLLMPAPPDEWTLGRLVRASGGDTGWPDPLLAHPQDASAFLRFDGRDSAYFATGWHQPERDGRIDYIWTSEPTSRLRIPLPQPMDLRVIVELRPANVDEHDPPLVALNVNGETFEHQPAGADRRMYVWNVPARAWRSGVNDVAIELTKITRLQDSHDQRQLGAAVSLFRLERVPR